MIRMRTLKYLPACLVLVPLAATALNGCSAAKALDDASAGCTALSATTNKAQATLLAFSQAAADLNVAAGTVQAKFLSVCNSINAELGLDTTKTTADTACAVLHQHVQAVVAAGATVTVTVVPHCDIDINAQAQCEAKCTPPTCEITPVRCMGGEVVVACNGMCSGSCDIKQPTVACMGSCQGSCDVAVACSGTCEGECSAPTFDGSCDAGCTASFEGKCDGMCNGTCNGTAMNGTTCTGTCKGTCTGSCTGKCGAQCTGHFSGGKCDVMCKGSCSVAAACSGKCDGTCTYTPGMATCQGECHGSCTAQVSPPTCTGSVDCMAPECHGSCQASAKAHIDCSKPEVNVTITGNDEAILLSAALHKHLQAWGEAVSLVVNLKDPVGSLAGKSIAAFEAIGDVGVAGASCLASSVQVMGQASVSINVSVTASASFSGSAN